MAISHADSVFHRDEEQHAPGTLVYRVVFVCFFVSGFCSLLYQVVWTRLAFAHFGTITPVLSLIVSVFMAGIGLGAVFGGRWAGALSSRWHVSSVFLYAGTEALIALGAFVVPATFDWGERLLLGTGNSDAASYLLLSAAFITVAVLPWSIAMGATIPLMMNFVREQAIDRADTSFSFLYLANVLGGAAGALMEAFVLIEILGIRGTYVVASFANVGIALVAIVLGRAITDRADPAVAESLVDTRPFSGAKPAARTRTILFTTGFCSLGMEVSWARDFTFSLYTTIYAFAAILAVYLLATATGSQMYRRRRSKGLTFPLDRMLIWLFVSALLPVIFTDPRLGHWAPRALASIVPLCGLLGFLTPSLVDDAAAGDPRRAGAYYGVNIAGSILGPLVAAYVLLPLLGIRWTLIVLALPFLALLAGSARPTFGRGIAYAGICTLMLGVAIFGSRAYDDGSLYSGPHLLHRDYVASVVAAGSGMDKQLYVNSIAITNLSTITKVMAHLPLALNGHASTALDICFGMGTTFRSLTSWDIETTAVDLSEGVVASFPFFHSDAAAVLAKPRIRIVLDDGRRYLMRTPQRFDVITIDPPPPVEAAGTSLLYSKDFYALLKTRLRDGGMLQQWIPLVNGSTLQSAALALRQSFPFLIAFRAASSGTYFIASMNPIQVPDAATFINRMPLAARRDLLEWEPHTTLTAVVVRILASKIPLSAVLPPAASQIPPISDDIPYNEYYVLREAGLFRF